MIRGVSETVPMIAIITSPNELCGIREHSEMLQEELDNFPLTTYCHPPDWRPSALWCPDVIHVDHHAALHAAWTPDLCGRLRKLHDVKVVITQHDTYESLDLMRSRGLPDFREHVDALIVHEPVAGLTDQGYDNVFYWRQPVPMLPAGCDWPTNDYSLRNAPPVVGTVGFDFPWKNFELLKECAKEAGWEARIFGGKDSWLSRDELLRELRKCDATAFLYQTGNSGTSAAIRMGIAARRPVIAFAGCRQFRDLTDRSDLIWCLDTAGVSGWLGDLACLHHTRKERAKRVEELADRDSWSNAGHRYAALYRRLVG